MPPVRITRTTRPLVPGNGSKITIEHDDDQSIQYEFYIPAAVWSHTVVRTFIQRLEQLAPGATIFKGATGVWHNKTTYVNI
jgi:hypothetical protein